MQFRLVYQGPLRIDGGTQRKQDIRRAFHPQIRELWTHVPLVENRNWLQFPAAENGLSVVRRLGDFRYAPLVSDELKLVAELEIVLLRPIRPGALIRQSGDIDNQLKPLFDALRCRISGTSFPAAIRRRMAKTRSSACSTTTRRSPIYT